MNKNNIHKNKKYIIIMKVVWFWVGESDMSQYEDLIHN